MFTQPVIERRMWRTAALVAMAGALTLSGCAKNDEAAPGTSAGPTKSTVEVAPKKVDDIAAGVPEDIRKSGKLVVGVTIPYTPNEFKDPDGKIVGFDVDLMNAVAATLGLTTDYRESDFSRIIPSIDGGTLQRRDVVVHRHQGAGEDGRLRHLLQRRHPVGAARR